MMWLWHFLGFDYGLPYGHVGAYNVWSGFLGDVSIVGGVGTALRMMVVHHRQKLAQSAKQQKELLAQGAEHHKVHMELLRKQHSQVLDAVPETQTVTVHVAGPADPGAIAEAVKKAVKPGGGM